MKGLIPGIFALLTLYGCSSDSADATTPLIVNTQPQPGTEAFVQARLGETVYAQLQSVDFPIHTGQNPPNLDFFLEMEGGKILKTNAPQFPVGTNTGKFWFALLDPRDNGMTITYESERDVTVGNPHFEQSEGYGTGYVSGNGDLFTVVASVDIYIDIDKEAKVHQILSGRVTPEGVVDCQLMEYLTYNRIGHPDLMMPGQYRVYGDPDGLLRIETF